MRRNDAGSRPRVSGLGTRMGRRNRSNPGGRSIALLVLFAAVIQVAFVASDIETALASEAPVASYSFNEGAGEFAHDSSGHGHDATLHGASWTGEGKYGGAIHFDAADHDHLTIPASPALNFTEAFTLEAWVKPEEERKWAPILAKTEAEEPDFSYLLYARDGEGKPEGQVFDGKEGWSVPKGSEPLPLNTWSHLALVFDGSDTRLYVNGKLAASDTLSVPPKITKEGL